MRGEELTTDGGAVDFDVMTELGFPDRAAYLARMAQFSGPGVGEQVAADETPQSPQNRLVSGFSVPHLGHRLASGAPRSPQKRLWSGFSEPQFEQRIHVFRQGVIPLLCTTAAAYL